MHEGRVSISGSVHSWAERRAALGAAKATPGVISLVDHLRIVPKLYPPSEARRRRWHRCACAHVRQWLSPRRPEAN
jgi:hypothetical protein